MVLELEHCALKIGYTQICTERARAREMAHKTGSKYFILLPQTIPLIESISAARKEALHRVILLMCVFITFQYNRMKNCDFPGRMCPSSRVLVLSRPFCRQSDSCSQLLPQPGVCAIQKKKKKAIFGVIPSFPSPSPSVHFFTPVHWKKLLATHWQLKIF